MMRVSLHREYYGLNISYIQIFSIGYIVLSDHVTFYRLLGNNDHYTMMMLTTREGTPEVK